MTTDTQVQTEITGRIRDVLATNTGDPDGFIDFDYPSFIESALRIFSKSVHHIRYLDHVVQNNQNGRQFSLGADQEFIAVEYPINQQPRKFLPALTYVTTLNGALTPIVELTNIGDDVPNGQTARVWYRFTWRLALLPADFREIIAEGAAGLAMRAQAFAYIRQSTLRPNSAQMLLGQANAMLTSFHAMVEQCRQDHNRLQRINIDLNAIRQTDVNLAIDATEVGNLSATTAAVEYLLRLNLIEHDEAKRITTKYSRQLSGD